MTIHRRLGLGGRMRDGGARTVRRSQTLVAPTASQRTFKVLDTTLKALWDLALGHCIFHPFLLTSHGDDPNRLKGLKCFMPSPAAKPLKRMFSGPRTPLTLVFVFLTFKTQFRTQLFKGIFLWVQ